ncbi:MAG: AraC family transcriptional regulator ligand-binding domain-containing protein [Ectothiorhodospiraceae bacterium]|nr:AraC family transcriptional regulator ligand-binding domain-containing protein [Ectothiorhodospiraceae bacterium]
MSAQRTQYSPRSIDREKQHTAANHFLSVLLRQGERFGIEKHRLLHEAEVPVGLADLPSARIATGKIARIIQIMWREMQDENLGFCENKIGIGAFHMMGKVAVNSPNLEAALKQGVRFYGLITDDFTLDLKKSNNEASFRLVMRRPELDPDHFLCEFLLITFHRFSSWLVGRNIILSNAHFSYAPPCHVDEYKFLFPSGHSFLNSENGFTFSDHYLKMPVVQNRANLKDFILRSPVDLLLKPRDDCTFTTQVRVLIEPLVHEGFPGIDEVAERLNLTSQTLRRKLKREGSSYRKIMDLVRRDLAIYYLTHKALSIGEISRLVGFAEPAAFIRAFKKWTGVTPGAYRNSPVAASSPMLGER